MKVSKDCRALQLSHLEQDDRGFYYAEIALPTEEVEYQPFELEVERYLQNSEMRVTCSSDGAGNGTWQLNCSTGDWKDRVEFSWESPIYRPYRSPDDAVIKVTSQDLNVSVTCRAENLISKASKTVFLKDVCSGQTKNLSRLPLWALLCLSLGGSLLLSGCMELVPMEKSRKADGGGGRWAQPHPGDD
ncbi:T-lymphocyte surface antigen Ly-9-like [Thamnophis elegans]|uniref:T-lymphocyte surface antigen Ly-9-like n=1 Tax=Thamnophis elegans TaxID=35005 RepID=UPI001378B9B9|nr:T-lymphocyte surface antigen Ly-9-like [Thamnophis elegans]